MTLQVGCHVRQEGGRSTEEVARVGVRHEVRQIRSRDPPLCVKNLALNINRGGAAVNAVQMNVRTVRGQISGFFLEGMMGSVPHAVHEPDGPAITGGGNLMQHAHQRRDADPGTNQHQRCFLRLRQNKFPRRFAAADD